jgi:hypothetical protein
MIATMTRTRTPAQSAALPVRYVFGLDLGKMSDHSALALAEERPANADEWRAWPPMSPRWAEDPRYGITWLQRWPLRTAYHSIAANVAGLVAELVARPGAEVQLFVDATGVGTAVVEILDREPAIAALGYKAVTITSGRAVTWVPGGWHVAKGQLLGPAQVALQRGMLDISPHLPHARTLEHELRNFDVTLTDSANATFSHREGQHDDLVLAVALALWGAQQRPVYCETFESFTFYTG